jgi:hypothetical protein
MLTGEPQQAGYVEYVLTFPSERGETISVVASERRGTGSGRREKGRCRCRKRIWVRFLRPVYQGHLKLDWEA